VRQPIMTSLENVDLAPTPEQIPSLLPMLAQRELREIVRRAITAAGSAAVPALAAALGDPALPRAVRLHLPRTLARIASPEVPGILLDRLEQETDGAIRFKLLRGLGRLRIAHPELPLDEGRVLALARAQVERAVDVLAWRLARPAGLVSELLADKEQHALERAFRLVGLLRPEVDYELYHRGVRSASRAEREVARELLAETLPRPLAAPLLALVAETDDAGRLAATSRFHRPRPVRLSTDHSEPLRRLALAEESTDDPAVRAAG
jgi:AAA family ATP:ADP antiporter